MSFLGKQRLKKIAKGTLNVAILLAVFGFGVGVGQGRIVFGPDALFRQSVQKEDLGKLDYRGVEELYSALIQSYDGQLDKAKLQDGIKEGLVNAAGDPYTEYLTAQENQEFNEQINGSFEGIGAELGKEDNFVIIISPLAGFPAKAAGLKSKDKIAEINGESAYNISVTEAVKKIRGEAGTEVELTIIRGNKSLKFKITRAQITIPSVKTEYLDGNIGVMKVSRFGDDTADLAFKAAQQFSRKNVNGVILDLRGNPGGRLDAAVTLAGLWLDKGQVVLEEKRAGVTIKTYEAEGNNLLGKIPTVVLIDSGSASASEISAGALSDNKKAILIGSQTFGKGSVQELRQLNFDGVLKVTVARWYTPLGRNIDKEGIKPDKSIKLTDKDAKADRDPARDAAIKYLQAN